MAKNRSINSQNLLNNNGNKDKVLRANESYLYLYIFGQIVHNLFDWIYTAQRYYTVLFLTGKLSKTNKQINMEKLYEF